MLKLFILISLSPLNRFAFFGVIEAARICQYFRDDGLTLSPPSSLVPSPHVKFKGFVLTPQTFWLTPCCSLNSESRTPIVSGIKPIPP